MGKKFVHFSLRGHAYQIPLRNFISMLVVGVVSLGLVAGLYATGQVQNILPKASGPVWECNSCGCGMSDYFDSRPQCRTDSTAKSGSTASTGVNQQCAADQKNAQQTSCLQGCCGSDGECPSGQKCNIGNGACHSGKSCNPNTAGGVHSICVNGACVKQPCDGNTASCPDDCSKCGGSTGSATGSSTGGGSGNTTTTGSICNGSGTPQGCMNIAVGSGCTSFRAGYASCLKNGTDSAGKIQCGCVINTNGAGITGDSCTQNSNCASGLCDPVKKTCAASGTTTAKCPTNSTAQTDGTCQCATTDATGKKFMVKPGETCPATVAATTNGTVNCVIYGSDQCATNNKPCHYDAGLKICLNNTSFTGGCTAENQACTTGSGEKGVCYATGATSFACTGCGSFSAVGAGSDGTKCLSHSAQCTWSPATGACLSNVAPAACDAAFSVGAQAGCILKGQDYDPISCKCVAPKTVTCYSTTRDIASGMYSCAAGQVDGSSCPANKFSNVAACAAEAVSLNKQVKDEQAQIAQPNSGSTCVPTASQITACGVRGVDLTTCQCKIAAPTLKTSGQTCGTNSDCQAGLACLPLAGTTYKTCQNLTVSCYDIAQDSAGKSSCVQRSAIGTTCPAGLYAQSALAECQTAAATRNAVFNIDQNQAPADQACSTYQVSNCPISHCSVGASPTENKVVCMDRPSAAQHFINCYSRVNNDPHTCSNFVTSMVQCPASSYSSAEACAQVPTTTVAAVGNQVAQTLTCSNPFFKAGRLAACAIQGQDLDTNACTCVPKPSRSNPDTATTTTTTAPTLETTGSKERTTKTDQAIQPTDTVVLIPAVNNTVNASCSTTDQAKLLLTCRLSGRGGINLTTCGCEFTPPAPASNTTVSCNIVKATLKRLTCGNQGGFDDTICDCRFATTQTVNSQTINQIQNCVSPNFCTQSNTCTSAGGTVTNNQCSSAGTVCCRPKSAATQPNVSHEQEVIDQNQVDCTTLTPIACSLNAACQTVDGKCLKK